jgi:DNA mismatch endonuclease (patch repair protein)
MADVFSKKKRSNVMSKIRSRSGLDRKLHHMLKGKKIKHKMYPKILGKPDAYLKDSNALIFLDGCFWHRCKRHFTMPKNNKEYWIQKIQKNVIRDKEVNKKLKKAGYKVVRIWEHELKSKAFDISKVIKKLSLE